MFHGKKKETGGEIEKKFENQIWKFFPEKKRDMGDV